MAKTVDKTSSCAYVEPALWRLNFFSFRPFGVALILIFGVCLAGCEVTPEKIARWKETERGPAKLQDVLRSSAVAPDLRGQALVALVELGMFSNAQTAMRDLNAAESTALVHAAVPSLIRLSHGSNRVDATTRVEREAKDALFLLREVAPITDRRSIDDDLIDWFIVDLAGREEAGGQSASKVLTTIGAFAAPRLAELLVDTRPSDAARLIAANILGKVADHSVREQVGARLVEQARRQHEPDETTLRRLGLVGGDHVVAYLTGIADDGYQSEKIRKNALLALALRPDAATLPTALRLAVDKKAPGAVRDAAFELAEKVGPMALGSLLSLIASTEDVVRWRAVEAVLSVGREKAVVAVLEALPASLTPSRDDLKSFIVHDLQLVGQAALAPLRDELKSSNWLARLVAIEALAVMGQPSDAAALEPLTSDGRKIKGWGKATMGSEAQYAIRVLRQQK